MARNKVKKNKILALRLSAFGDVAMTVPVLTQLAAEYPDTDITLLSRPFAAPLYANAPENLHIRIFRPEDCNNVGKLVIFAHHLKDEGYTHVADLHDVIRTKIIRTVLKAGGMKVSVIDKGRKEKLAITRTRDKIIRQLPTSFERYAMTFKELGFPVTDLYAFTSIYNKGKGDPQLFASLTGTEKETPWIGFAPFAAHTGKTLPETTGRKLLELIEKRHSNWKIFLFGGGKMEISKLNTLSSAISNAVCVAGKLDLAGELSLMSHLDLLVSMDSANMHLASITATPVISVWGATHHMTGFLGWKQSTGNIIQSDIPCRPCSVFGNKPCRNGDYACLHNITAEEILERMESVINGKSR